MTTKTDQRSAARPGSNVGSCCIPAIKTRDLDGDEAINFDDHIAEEHAIAMVNLLRPLLVDEWRIVPTELWGRYTLKSPGWVEKYSIRTLFQLDQIKVVVRVEGNCSLGPPGAFEYWPIEYPHIVEAAAQFVFEQMKTGYNARCFINQPPFPAT
jgi:hypothetical protein